MASRRVFRDPKHRPKQGPKRREKLMGWARLDDQRATNRKLMEAGLEARGLDEAAICWAAGNLTDGLIPEHAVAMLAAGHGCTSWRKVVRRLVQVGRWVEIDGGWQIHDYLDYNPSRFQVESQRESDRKRKRRPPGDPGGTADGTPPGIRPDGGPASGSPRARGGARTRGRNPSRPVPSPAPEASECVQSSSSGGVGDDDDRYGQVLELLAGHDLERRETEAGPVGNPSAWLEQARQRRADTDGDAIRQLLTERPEFDPATVVATLRHRATGQPAERPEEATGRARQAMYDEQTARRDHPCGACNGARLVEGLGGRFVKCAACDGTGVDRAAAGVTG